MGNPLKKLEKSARHAVGGVKDAFHKVDKLARDADPLKHGVSNSLAALDKARRDDPVSKFVEAPIKSALAADPLYQRLTHGRAGSPNERIHGGVHELFSEDPLGAHVGIKEQDAERAAKVAGLVAAAYFTAGAAGSMLGGTGAGAGAAGVSGEAGAVASVGAGSSGVAAGTAAATTALTIKDYAVIAGSVLSGVSALTTAAALRKGPDEIPPAPELEDPFTSEAPEQTAQRQKRKTVADIGKFDTILTGPLGLDTLGGDATGKRKTILGS